MISDPAQIPGIVASLSPDADIPSELRRRGATDAMIRQYVLSNMPTRVGDWMSLLGEEMAGIFGQSPAVAEERRRTSTGSRVRQAAEQIGLPAPPNAPATTLPFGMSAADLTWPTAITGLPGLGILNMLRNRRSQQQLPQAVGQPGNPVSFWDMTPEQRAAEGRRRFMGMFSR
jgi:hypothetical protein